MLDILGIAAFAVVFGLWWAGKPRWSRVPHGADAFHDPLLGEATVRRSTSAPAREHQGTSRPAAPTREQQAQPRTATALRGNREAPRTATAPRTPAAAEAHGFRPDIEGLRAIAVLLVLGYHIGEVRYSADRVGGERPWFFDGGFIGVDVFFVLSGFLITSLLLRELRTTGRISLAAFWSRRARRLLAASSLTIVATLVASRWMLDPLAREQLARDAVAASLFVSNIAFARRGSDYLTAQEAPSPLLHFWSLSLEEQFYLVWPALLLVVTRGRDLVRRAAWLVGGLGVVSFVACVWFTDTKPVWAFYLLPTRAWELLVGAGLAVAGTTVLRVPERTRAIGAWAGLAAILVAAYTFSTASNFPGAIALVPVLGTAAVILAGGLGTAGSPAQLLSAAPLQWIGKRSYAIYLWHWPALVLFEAHYGPLGLWQLVAVVVASVGLAAVSYRFVEDPVRRTTALAAPPRKGLALGGVLVAVGVLAAALVLNNQQRLSGGGDASTPTLAVPTTAAPGPADTDATTNGSDPPSSTTAAPPPIGDLDELEAAAAPVLEEAAQTEVVPDNLDPGLRAVRSDLPAIYDDGCLLPESGRTTSGDCVYGDPDSDTTVVLAGDSHAAQWFPAFALAAERRGWRLVVLAKRGCPAADFTTYGAGGRERTGCDPWREGVAERLATEQPDLLVVTSYRYRLTNEDAPADSGETWQAALEETFASWRPFATEMLVLSDTPNPKEDVPACLSGNLRDVPDCVQTRAKGDKEELLDAERAAAEANDASLAVTSNWLCGPTTCPVILGDLLMYRDDNHISATFAEYLTPFVEAAIAPLL